MTRETPGRHVFLVGFMGAGKSTVGRMLADLLKRPFVDLDARVEEQTGRSVAEVFVEAGEEAFRAIESETLALLRGAEPSVVACGGGIVLLPENRHVLRELGTVVYLKVTAGEALARIGDVEGRPLLATGDPSAATTLLTAREGLYRAVADLAFDTAGQDPGAIAARIADELTIGGVVR